MLWQTLLLLLLSLFLSPSFVFPSVIFLVDCVQMSQHQQQQENIYDLFYLFITGFSLCVCVQFVAVASFVVLSILWRKEWCMRPRVYTLSFCSHCVQKWNIYIIFGW